MFDFLSGLDTTAWLLAKIVVIVFMVIYNIFAVVVVKQVNLMTATLRIGLESTIKVVVYLHFAFAVGLLLIAVFVL